jgi:hypothetical protein
LVSASRNSSSSVASGYDNMRTNTRPVASPRASGSVSGITLVALRAIGNTLPIFRRRAKPAHASPRRRGCPPGHPRLHQMCKRIALLIQGVGQFLESCATQQGRARPGQAASPRQKSPLPGTARRAARSVGIPTVACHHTWRSGVGWAPCAHREMARVITGGHGVPTLRREGRIPTGACLHCLGKSVPARKRRAREPRSTQMGPQQFEDPAFHA